MDIRILRQRCAQCKRFVGVAGCRSPRHDGRDLQVLDEDGVPKAVERIEVGDKEPKAVGEELVTHLGPRWAPDVLMHAMHPGWVDTPGVESGLPLFGKITGPILRTPEEGADTLVWLAASGGSPSKR